MGNMDLWDRYADIDPKFTKAITGKDYGGTSPNPQYVIRCLTEMFGPVGKGFGWTVLADEFQALGDSYLHWCRIRFWWADESGAHHSVEEYGQTKAAYTTSGGKYRIDEDAPKKSLTDAIIKGASHLGIAGNIFLGRWDDQKYVSEVNADYRARERDSEPPKEPDPKDVEVADRLINAVSSNGVATADDERFTKTLAILRNNAPALAANVDAAIKIAREGKAA